MTGFSQYLAGGNGGGIGGNFLLAKLVKIGVFTEETSETLEGELWVSPEKLPGGEYTGAFLSRAGGGGIGLTGAGKFIKESGDFDLILLGLISNAIEGLLESEEDLEDGYDVVFEFELPFSGCTKSVCNSFSGLIFPTDEALGEKNSSSSSSSKTVFL